MLPPICAVLLPYDILTVTLLPKSLYEAYLMFTSAVPYRGTAGLKWDAAAVSGGHYVGPPGTGCGSNHIIFLANG